MNRVGWLVAAGCLLLVGGVAWRVSGWQFDEGRVRDPFHGFDLSGSIVPVERIVATQLAADGLPPLDDPPMMPGAEVAAYNEEHRGKYLVSADLVIGVVIDGEARAYPLRVLNWHEVANDRIGSTPIAVTYNPLCDSVAVFDRNVGDETLTFAVSGLVYNTNLLLFDRRAERSGSSLWSQLLGRPIAGPAAERDRALRTLPVSLAAWSVWLESHPDTLVVRPAPDMIKRYQRNPYGNYLLTGKPRFPVFPLPAADTWPAMTPVLAISRGADSSVLPLNQGDVRDYLASPESWGVRVDLDHSMGVASALVHAPGDVGTVYARWFAWYSHHPHRVGVAIRPDDAD